MAAALQTVYTQRPISERSNDVIHASVKELVDRNSVTRRILDLGCSDGVATWGMENIDPIGVDKDPTALSIAKRHDPNYKGVCADIQRLPFDKDSLRNIDVILALDVLEHVPFASSVSVLQYLRTTMPKDHTLIATIPICSPLSVETWREAMGVVKNRTRPNTGIFDNTHKILTGRKGHHKLFREGGYEVVEEYQSNRIVGATGEWQWQERQLGEPYLIERLKHRGMEDSALTLRAARFLTNIYMRMTESNSSATERIGKSLFAYQGLYVVQPD